MGRPELQVRRDPAVRMAWQVLPVLRVRQAQPVQVVSQDLQEWTAALVRLVPADPPVPQVRVDPQDPQVRPERPEQQDLPDPQELQVRQDLQELMA